MGFRHLLWLSRLYALLLYGRLKSIPCSYAGWAGSLPPQRHNLPQWAPPIFKPGLDKIFIVFSSESLTLVQKCGSIIYAVWTISSAGMSIRLTCGRSQVQVLYRPPEKSLETQRFQGFFFCLEGFYPYWVLRRTRSGRHALDELLHAIRAGLFHLGRHMAVHIKSKGRRRMAQVFLHGLDVIPTLNRHDGVGMP